ncbi:MAG: hypothetical protein QOD56_1164 [Gammaproteobacteria bacterium]|jgi:hypothetical protein|nr:hypothetical protein [Gammaproteobacteria bacterium]
MRAPLALLLIAAGLPLAACATAGANPLYADGYGATPYFDQSLCGTYAWTGSINYPYCGWYNGYFYPGRGGYVYDHNRGGRPMTPAEQNHWSGGNPTLSTGMHSPGPAQIGGGIGGGGHGFAGGGRGFGGGGRGFGGGRGAGGGHSGR